MVDSARWAPRAAALLLGAVVPGLPAFADETRDTSLAMQLSNPVAALISLPLQLNYDQDIGPVDDGDRWLLNVQPVIPFDLNDDWNLISRTILPVVRQSDIFPGAGTQNGIGDVVLKQSNGWTRGVLANHLWSFTGDDDRADVNATFLQPFLTYTTPTQWTFALNTESTYDWEAEQWSVPRASDCGSRSRFFFRGSQLEQSAVST